MNQTTQIIFRLPCARSEESEFTLLSPLMTSVGNFDGVSIRLLAHPYGSLNDGEQLVKS